MLNMNDRILSKEATDEILGKDLCFLIAFGRNGEVVPFYRNGVESNPECDQNTSLLDFVNITFNNVVDDKKNTPKEGELVQGLRMDINEVEEVPAMSLMKKQVKHCLVGGEWMACNGFPCP
jgi:hypothetical protein